MNVPLNCTIYFIHKKRFRATQVASGDSADGVSGNVDITTGAAALVAGEQVTSGNITLVTGDAALGNAGGITIAGGDGGLAASVGSEVRVQAGAATGDVFLFYFS